MDYKTILVHANESRGTNARVALAAGLAIGHGAHLVGLVQTGIERFVHGAPPGGYRGDMTSLFADLRTYAQQCATRFDAQVRRLGVESFEHRIGDEEAGYALAARSMYADLVIVGQSAPNDPVTGHAGIPEYVALHAPCPVLVLPCAAALRPAFRHIIVAWNASRESARAVRLALPLLARATNIEVATLSRHAGDDAVPDGTDVALFLARHGINVGLWQGCAGGDAADALLDRVSDSGADLLVMGCYGHLRLRELLLGGVSRSVLRRMTVPTLMAH